jgi:hypothetical protein
LLKAVPERLVETLRPLLPVGYAAGALAYRKAVDDLTPATLSGHYTEGLRFFHDVFAPRLRAVLEALAGGAWSLGDYVAYAAGSDVDFMAHLVEAAAAREGVSLFPGDWYGFLVGATQTAGIRWAEESGGRLACLCIPSVRNGHLTEPMLSFLESAPACLLNLNLFPTLAADERRDVAQALSGVLPRSVLSISFSRGFGLTASQLGVALVHEDHPFRERFATQWSWLTYFYNAVAARAFLAVDHAALAEVDAARRRWVLGWLAENGLPAVETGSYYVKAFRVDGAVPELLRPLTRDGVVRLCFKPPQV